MIETAQSMEHLTTFYFFSCICICNISFIPIFLFAAFVWIGNATAIFLYVCFYFDLPTPSLLATQMGYFVYAALIFILLRTVVHYGSVPVKAEISVPQIQSSNKTEEFTELHP